MIGQRNLQSRIEQLINNDSFPRFSILVGPKGSGKKTLAHQMACDLKALIYDCDVKIDAIRSMITDCYKLWEKTCYVIADADNMSNAAKNALLKVTEEPPNNAYFIMTLENENNTLDTIRSRGTVFHMDRYTPDEIFEYYWTVGNMPNDAERVRDICATPGEVKKCIEMCDGTIQSFYDYVQLVVDNIAEVSLANAFKIPGKVSLKEDAEGYDLRLFWKAVANVMLDNAKQRGNSEELVKYCDGYSVTSKYLQKLKTKGINRQMLIDNWLLEIRDLWM